MSFSHRHEVDVVLFENLTLTEGDFGLDVSKLPLYRLPHWRGIALERAARSRRLRFEHCDCSNVNLQKASLNEHAFGPWRVRWRNAFRKRFCSTYR